MLIRKTDKHLPAYGFYLRDVEDTTLRGIRLRRQAPDTRRGPERRADGTGDPPADLEATGWQCLGHRRPTVPLVNAGVTAAQRITVAGQVDLHAEPPAVDPRVVVADTSHREFDASFVGLFHVDKHGLGVLPKCRCRVPRREVSRGSNRGK